MQDPLSKSERQRLIGSLVTRMALGTQHELLAALAGAGCRVTQATISRDIRELRLEKARDSLGRPRYVLPQRATRPDPRATLAAVLLQRQAFASAPLPTALLIVHCALTLEGFVLVAPQGVTAGMIRALADDGNAATMARWLEDRAVPSASG